MNCLHPLKRLILMRDPLEEIENDNLVSGWKRTQTAAMIVFIIVYLTFAGSFGAWHGRHLWQLPHIVLILAIPTVFVGLFMLPGALLALRNRMLNLFILHLVIAPILAAVTFGGVGLLIAYLLAETVGDWRSQLVRTVVSGLGFLLIAALTLASRRHLRERS